MIPAPHLVATFGLLACAVVALWLPVPAIGTSRAWLWSGLLGLACCAGLAFGFLGWAAPVWIVLLACVAAAARDAPQGMWRWVLLCATVLLSLLMALHRLPGFFNPDLLKVAVPGLPAPVTVRGNIDKTAVGIILVGVFCQPIRTLHAWRTVLRQTLPVMAVTVALVLGLATLLGYVQLDPKWPSYAPLFLAGNLLSTCVAEEAFFRGLLLRQFASSWSGWRYGTPAALILTSLLFGAVHAGGGPVLVLMATIAGAGYGIAYLRSRRIEAAVLTHFALNAVHFVAFSYPSLHG